MKYLASFAFMILAQSICFGQQTPAEQAPLAAERIRAATDSPNIDRVHLADALDVQTRASAPVRRWINFNSEYSITPESEDFGAKLQLAIDDAIANNWGIVIDPGLYDYERGVVIGKRSEGSWHLVQAPPIVSSVLAGRPLAAYPDSPHVQLNATFDDMPLFSFQGVRGGLLSGFILRCKTPATGADYESATVAQKVTDVSLYDNGQRQNQFSPECAIAIDPFGNHVPPEDRYPGANTAMYMANEAYSSGITIRHCFLDQGEAGIVIGAGVGSNSDGIDIDCCTISHCKWAVSCCHAQTKNVVLNRTGASYVWCVATNGVHGDQNGRLPFVQWFGQSSFIGNIVAELHSDSPFIFTGGHSEVVGRIGDFSVGSGSSQPVVFRDCSFNFFGHPAATIKNKQRMVSFENCGFFAGDQETVIETTAGVDIPSNFDSGYFTPRGEPLAAAYTMFRNCHFQSGKATASVQDVVQVAATSQARKDWIQFDHCLIRAEDNSPYSRLINGGGSLIPESQE